MQNGDDFSQAVFGFHGTAFGGSMYYRNMPVNRRRCHIVAPPSAVPVTPPTKLMAVNRRPTSNMGAGNVPAGKTLFGFLVVT